MTAQPSHRSSDDECTCDRDQHMIVSFEEAAVFERQADGWVPVPNRSRQPGIPLSMLSSHRIATTADVTATRGARRGSFIGDGRPVDTPAYPDRVPDYLVVWPEWDAFHARRDAS